MKKTLIILVLLILFVSIAFAEPDVSPWTGVAYPVSTYLENNLKDPESLDIIDCGQLVQLKGYWAQRVRYRAKNSFGGFVIENKIFMMDYNKDSWEYEVVTYVDYSR